MTSKRDPDRKAHGHDRAVTSGRRRVPHQKSASSTSSRRGGNGTRGKRTGGRTPQAFKRLIGLARRRGETLPDDPGALACLLAHERFRGRTGERYAKPRAKTELDGLLDNRSRKFPLPRAREYFGMTELRTYAATREKVRVDEHMRALNAAAFGNPFVHAQEALVKDNNRIPTRRRTTK